MKTCEEILRAAVRERRVAAGWTQAELADRMRDLGVPLTRSAVPAMENGDRAISVTECLLLAHVFGTTMHELISGGPDAFSVALPDGSEGVLALGALTPIGESKTPRMPAARDPVDCGASVKLGMSREDVRKKSLELWGKTLRERRDEIVSAAAPVGILPRARQALRAHAARKLYEELQSYCATPAG